jgi:hypothetical protein
MTKHIHHHTGRFSEGMEQVPPLAASHHIGTFADGMALTAIARIGSFADGLALRPDAPGARRVGSFGDVEPRGSVTGPVRPRLGVPHGEPRPYPA